MTDWFRSLRSAQEAARDDEGFRQELLEQSRFAAGAIGAIEFILAALAVVRETTRSGDQMVQNFAVSGMLLVGAGTLLCSRQPRLYPYAKVVAIASCWLWSALLAAVAPAANVVPIAGAILMVAAALIPLTSVQAALGCAAVLCMAIAAPLSFDQTWVLGALACAAAALAIAQSVNRWRMYSAHLHLVRSSQELRMVQSRALSAGHAASVERLAAAVSHELNSPVGALKSAADTLREIRDRYTSASDGVRTKLDALQGDVLTNMVAAAGRIEEIVGRLQRFGNMDRAAIRPTDIAALLRDVVAIVQATRESHPRFHVDLEELPEVLCAPVAWTSIFQTLAAHAIEQSPAASAPIITARQRDHEIIVEFCTTVGEGHARPRLDPEFVVEGARIGASNWNLFHARLLTQQQGGDLWQLTDPERGLITRVSIPCSADTIGEAARVSEPRRGGRTHGSAAR